MYIAALRIADDFGCDAIGIQYQQGLKDLLPASDLVEGTLNNADRPPVTSRDGQRDAVRRRAAAALQRSRRVRRARRPDDVPRAQGAWASRSRTRCTTCAGATSTDQRHGRRLRVGVPDQRLARRRRTSSAAGPAPRSERQPAMYFRLGGGTLKGISQAGRDRLVAGSTSRTGG